MLLCFSKDSAKSMLAINETAKIEPLKLKSMLVTNESVMETMLIDDAIIDNITAQIGICVLMLLLGISTAH